MKAARIEFKTSFDNAGRSIDETRRQHQRNFVRTSKWEMYKRQQRQPGHTRTIRGG